MADNGEQTNSGLGFVHSYKTKGALPGVTPAATIYFDGLLCMCFKGNTECTVGAHKHPPSHNLKLEIWNKATCTAIDPFPAGVELADFKEFEIGVEKAVLDGVYAYNGPSASPAGISSEIRDSYKYCVDLEEAHGASLRAKAGALSTRVRIKNGLFSAYKLSASTFELRRLGEGPRSLGNIALAVAADIFMSAEGNITLKGIRSEGGKPSFSYDLHWKPGTQYEIGITNSCDGCKFDPADSDKTKRNDFWLYYEALDVPNPDDQFQLFNTGVAGSTEPPVLGHCIRATSSGPFSDPAPCMPITLGQSSEIINSP